MYEKFQYGIPSNLLPVIVIGKLHWFHCSCWGCFCPGSEKTPGWTIQTLQGKSLWNHLEGIMPVLLVAIACLRNRKLPLSWGFISIAPNECCPTLCIVWGFFHIRLSQEILFGWDFFYLWRFKSFCLQMLEKNVNFENQVYQYYLIYLSYYLLI